MNVRKSSLEPAQTATYIGLLLDTVQFKVFPAPRRTEKFIQHAKQFLKLKAPVLLKWESLLGEMSSLCRIVQGAQLRMRPLQFQLQVFRSKERNPSERILLNTESIRAVRWWIAHLSLNKGLRLGLPQPSIHLETDASLEGWGAHAEGVLQSGKWTQKETKLHINVLEIRAVIRALQANPKNFKGKTIALLGDNTTALSYIKHGGGTKSRTCNAEAEQLLLWTEAQEITLVPRFIPGERNVIADTLSRKKQIIQSEWTLNQEICKRLWSLWETPQWDLFATRFNNRLQTFVSPVPDHRVWAVDAFLQDWSGTTAYAYPPTRTIRKVVAKIKASRNARVILIAPCWPQQQWFPDLLELLIDHPRRLPLWRNLLIQTHSKQRSTQLQILQLHAWRLSSVYSEQEAFRKDQRTLSRLAIETQPSAYTSQSGESFAIGVAKGNTIHSIPLFQY